MSTWAHKHICHFITYARRGTVVANSKIITLTSLQALWDSITKGDIDCYESCWCKRTALFRLLFVMFVIHPSTQLKRLWRIFLYNKLKLRIMKQDKVVDEPKIPVLLAKLSELLPDHQKYTADRSLVKIRINLGPHTATLDCSALMRFNVVVCTQSCFWWIAHLSLRPQYFLIEILIFYQFFIANNGPVALPCNNDLRMKIRSIEFFRRHSSRDRCVCNSLKMSWLLWYRFRSPFN